MKMQIIKFETKEPPIKLTRFIGYTPVTCLTSLKTAKLSPWSFHDDSCFFALFMAWLNRTTYIG